MDFFGIGYQELLLVMVLLLVVVGPERLPQMAYQVGRIVRQMQRYARAVRDEFSDEFEYLEEQYKTVKGELTDAQLEMRQKQREMEAEMRSATAGLDQPLIPPPSVNGASASPSAPVQDSAPAEAKPESNEPPLVF